MNNKIVYCILILINTCCCFCYADQPLKIVATLSSFADIAKNIGGDLVEVSSIASPRFNPHFIEAKPSDVIKLKRTDLYLHSGLDLEAWEGPLVDAAARPDIRKSGKLQLDLSQGITLLEVPNGQVSRSEGDIHLLGNPHYWLDPRNAKIIAQAIAAKLSELDPAHAAQYSSNLKIFLDELDIKIAEWQNLLAPFKSEKLIGYHNEWVYLMNFSGLKMEEFLEPKPGIPPSPAHLEEIISYIRTNKVKALVQPTFYPKDAAENVSEKTGAKVVFACQNVGEIPEASNYISLIEYNIKEIAGALKS